MNMLSVRRNAALVSVTLSLSLFICFLAISAKVPVRVTLTPLSITVEFNPDKSPSCGDHPERTMQGALCRR